MPHAQPSLNWFWRVCKYQTPHAYSSVMFQQDNLTYCTQGLATTIFFYNNGLSKPGIKISRKLMTARFIWLGMIKDDSNRGAKTCLPCQQSDVNGLALQGWWYLG